MNLKSLFTTLNTNKAVWYFLSTGLIFLVLAVYLQFAGFPYLLNIKIKESIALNNGTQAMKAWENLPKPLEFRIYIFNVSNPEEVSQGSKPIVQEVGPYVYDEHRTKVNVQTMDDDTLTYKVKKTFFFNQEKSGSLRESDMVTVLNIPFLGTAYTVEERFPVGLSFLSSAMPFLFPNISDIFLRVPIGQLLFSGIPIKCDYETGPAMPVCRGIRTNRPPPLREDPETKGFAFSMFQAENTSVSGLFRVYRGNKNIYDLGKIVEYNNLTYLSIWDKNTKCSELKGTDSSILAPVQNKEDNIYLYLPEVCLSLRASFEEETDMFGIQTYKYISSYDNFASPTTVPENICRCKKPQDKKKGSPICLKAGAIDATKCQGAPVILTPPHFLHCDREYKDYPTGLTPDKSKHETEVYLEPNTGVPLAAFKRIQMNIFLRKLDGIDLLANVSEGLFPLAWVEEALAQEMVDTYIPALKDLVKATVIMESVSWVLLGVGIVCTVISGILFLKLRKVLCFTANKVVSNISFVGPGDSLGKSRDILNDKRGVFNIPKLDNENISGNSFSLNAPNLERKSDSLAKTAGNSAR